MACPAPLDARERALLDALTRVAAWRFRGDWLILLDAADLALIEAQVVHLD
jgi:heat shock protein HslJ